nr:glycosyltransferase [Allobaculum sp. Allo2]
MGKYYQAFDAFVSASLSETQGMTYLEAMAAGRMVFGRRDEVLDDLLEEGKTGFYFNSPEELNVKIEQFIALDPAKKRKPVRNVRRKSGR